MPDCLAHQPPARLFPFASTVWFTMIQLCKAKLRYWARYIVNWLSESSPPSSGCGMQFRLKLHMFASKSTVSDWPRDVNVELDGVHL